MTQTPTEPNNVINMRIAKLKFRKNHIACKLARSDVSETRRLKLITREALVSERLAKLKEVRIARKLAADDISETKRLHLDKRQAIVSENLAKLKARVEKLGADGFRKHHAAKVIQRKFWLRWISAKNAWRPAGLVSIKALRGKGMGKGKAFRGKRMGTMGNSLRGMGGKGCHMHVHLDGMGGKGRHVHVHLGGMGGKGRHVHVHLHGVSGTGMRSKCMGDGADGPICEDGLSNVEKGILNETDSASSTADVDHEREDALDIPVAQEIESTEASTAQDEKIALALDGLDV